MQIDKLVSLIGGILLIVIGVYLLAINTGHGVCKPQGFCSLAAIVIFSMFLGLCFISYALENTREKRKQEVKNG